MSIAETIKAARERAGMTQEQLAERLYLSRQAVSKWEMGASLPSPENLRILTEVLGVDFTPAEEAPATVSPALKPWKHAVLVLAVLLLLAFLILAAVLFRQHDSVPEAPAISEICFFDETGTAFDPNLGDGWYSFTSDNRIVMAVSFRNGAEASVYAVSLFLTPAGSETFDQREQMAVQAVPDGRNFALFVLNIPQDLMGHLDILLECTGGQTITETLNVTSLA